MTRPRADYGENPFSQSERKYREAQDIALDIFRHFVYDLCMTQGIHSSKVEEAFAQALVSIKRKEAILGQ